MCFSGITFNVISLANLALGMNMPVDNSIIKNIYRWKSQGISSSEAAAKGTQ